MLARYAIQIIFLGVALRVLAVVFSLGFHHADEHFQILEFLHHFRYPELSRSEDLPWEYAAKIRPWIQILFYDRLASLAEFLGLRDPWTHAMLFRASTATLSLAASKWLLDAIRVRLNATVAGLAASALFFAIPYLAARISSEAVAGWLFTAAVGLYLRAREPRGRTIAGVGLLIGLAVAVRYQVGLLAAGFGLWMLVIDRLPAKRWLVLVGIAFLVQLVSIALDRIGYGEWAFVVGNNFDVNVLQGRARDYGVEPWWAYLRFLGETAPPLGLLGVVLLARFLWHGRRDPIAWSLGPFLLVHVFLAHKELRFLFPIIPLVPWIVATTLPTVWPERRSPRLAAGLVLGFNLLYAIFFAVTVRRTEIAFLAKVDTAYPQGFDYVTYGEDPHRMAGVPVPVRYYRNPNTRSIGTLLPESDPSIALRSFGPEVLVVRTGRGFLARDHPLWRICVREVGSLPNWTEDAPAWMGVGRLHVRELFRCRT